MDEDQIGIALNAMNAVIYRAEREGLIKSAECMRKTKGIYLREALKKIDAKTLKQQNLSHNDHYDVHQ